MVVCKVVDDFVAMRAEERVFQLTGFVFAPTVEIAIVNAEDFHEDAPEEPL